MEFKELDRLIDRLEAITPEAPSIWGIGLTRHDWRPVWNLAKEIQEGFNEGVRYSSGALRQASWTRFNSLRDEASRRATAEKAQWHEKSKLLRDNILDDCKNLGYSKLTDALFFWDPTTIEDMKQLGRRLREAMMKLSEHKHEMLAEHKQQCFQRFEEIKEEHEFFWSQYRTARSQRRIEVRQRFEANLEKNREKHRHASSTLERFREKADDLREKISSTQSTKWQEIWSGWLAETESKIEDIETQITRLEEWIEDDLRKLNDMDR